MSNDNDQGATPLATDSFMYDREKAHPDAIRSFSENAKTHALMTPEAADQHVERSWLPVIKRYDLLSGEARSLADLDALAHQKVPDNQTRAAWANDAKVALLETYGADGVGQALKDAKTFIAQDPQLRRFASRGFGDHKDMVLMAARLGREARKSGKLK